jgi:hypothetical protein
MPVLDAGAGPARSREQRWPAIACGTEGDDEDQRSLGVLAITGSAKSENDTPYETEQL